MNIIFLIFISQFVFSEGGDARSDDPTETSLQASSHHHVCDHRPLVKLRIISNDEVILHVDLKQTKRSLANEHLPVWISKKRVDRIALQNEKNHGLERINDVMEQLGEFTTYQDSKTSSAAVYFHKRREFDGMIGYGLLIQHLSDDEIHPTEETSLTLDEQGVYTRLGYEGHTNTLQDSVKDPESGVNYQEYMNTYGGRVYDGYPEVLVILSWDVVADWTDSVDESDLYTTVVSHVITLFNGIDMLYAKLQKTKVQINIAGIIIEGKQSFLFLADCYYSSGTASEPTQYKLDAKCVNAQLRIYLHTRKEEIPTDSYDMVVHLTRENLYSVEDTYINNEIDGTSDVLLAGSSDFILQLYKSRHEDYETVLVGTVTYADYLENYPTIAHEMAHLMTVKHDEPHYFTQDGTCCGHILKTVGGWCDKCMSWSETSEETFKLFFSSPNCCSFINKPRSLNPPGQQQMLTADEQCQCYGYESARKLALVPESFCQSGIQCKAMDHVYIETVKPMDGTPCDEDKICWRGLCEETKVHESVQSVFHYFR